PTFFFYCNTCNVLPGPAVGWGWCVGVVLRRGVACGGIETGGGGGPGPAPSAWAGQQAQQAQSPRHPRPASLPPRAEGWMGFHVLAAVVAAVGRLLCGVRLLAVGRSGYSVDEGYSW